MSDVEAWVVGLDNLPPELLAYANNARRGDVVVREEYKPEQYQIMVMSPARFDSEFQWL